MKTFPKLHEKYQNQTPSQEKTSCFLISLVSKPAYWLYGFYQYGLAHQHLSFDEGPTHCVCSMQICAVLTLCLNEKKSVVKVNVCSTNTSVWSCFSSTINGELSMFYPFSKQIVQTLITANPPPPIISYCLIVIVLLAHIDVSFTLANENNVFAAFS